jgi:hypothetical protein
MNSESHIGFAFRNDMSCITLTTVETLCQP